MAADLRSAGWNLAVRNLLFSVVVPGAGAVWMPWWILGRFDPTAAPAAWPAAAVIAAGTALYLWCVWVFAVAGHGTPGPWDAPRRLVAVGPYRWVRNPIYLAALLVVLGEAGVFPFPPPLLFAGADGCCFAPVWDGFGGRGLCPPVVAMAVCCHLFVIGYEERTLRRRFGDAYLEYLQTVPRWLPRPPRRG